MSNKNSETTRQVENYWRQKRELQTTNLSTRRVHRNSENAAKRPKKTESTRKSSKPRSYHSQEHNRRTEERRKNSSTAKPTSTTKKRRTERTSRSPTPGGATRRDGRRRRETNDPTKTRGQTMRQTGGQRSEARDQRGGPRTEPASEKKNRITNDPRRIRTWSCSTTLARAVPSLSTQKRPCTPDFGPGTSALRSYRVEVGWATAPLFSTASEQVPRVVRADSTGAGHPPQAAQRRTAQLEFSQVWTSSA